MISTDHGQLVVFVLLDLSPAFDIIDYFLLGWKTCPIRKEKYLNSFNFTNMYEPVTSIWRAAYYNLQKIQAFFAQGAPVTVVHPFVSSHISFIIVQLAWRRKKTRKYDHISSILQNKLHWPPVRQRIHSNHLSLTLNWCQSESDPENSYHPVRNYCRYLWWWLRD